MMKDKDQPLYMISVVSRILDVHPQTLRMYEKEGLVTPHRANGQRLYSESDVERLAMILRLSKDLGVNRVGVDIILRMRHRLQCLQTEVQEMMQLLDEDIRQDFEEKIRRIFKEEE